jgi:hypothetical protein
MFPDFNGLRDDHESAREALASHIYDKEVGLQNPSWLLPAGLAEGAVYN